MKWRNDHKHWNALFCVETMKCYLSYVCFLAVIDVRSTSEPLRKCIRSFFSHSILNAQTFFEEKKNAWKYFLFPAHGIAWISWQTIKKKTPSNQFSALPSRNILNRWHCEKFTSILGAHRIGFTFSVFTCVSLLLLNFVCFATAPDKSWNFNQITRTQTGPSRAYHFNWFRVVDSTKCSSLAFFTLIGVLCAVARSQKLSLHLSLQMIHTSLIISAILRAIFSRVNLWDLRLIFG